MNGWIVFYVLFTAGAMYAGIAALRFRRPGYLVFVIASGYLAAHSLLAVFTAP